jgi:hypothetical protein
MDRFLNTPAHEESYVAGHPSRQNLKEKNLIALLDSVLTTLHGQGNVSKTTSDQSERANVSALDSCFTAADLASSIRLEPAEALPRSCKQAKPGNPWCCNPSEIEALVDLKHFDMIDDSLNTCTAL